MISVIKFFSKFFSLQEYYTYVRKGKVNLEALKKIAHGRVSLAPHHGSQRFKSERERRTFVFSLVFPTLSEAPSSRTRRSGVVCMRGGGNSRGDPSSFWHHWPPIQKSRRHIELARCILLLAIMLKIERIVPSLATGLKV